MRGTFFLPCFEYETAFAFRSNITNSVQYEIPLAFLQIKMKTKKVREI